MKILLTGASGFIGKNLITYLLSQGHEVLTLGRTDINISKVHSIRLTEFTLKSIEKALLGQTFEAVINMASAGVNPHDRDISQLLNINVLLPSYLLMASVNCGAKAFITTGSSAEYKPVPTQERITETYPLETNKMYGASKASGGLVAIANGINLGIPVAVTRLFNVFGPGEAPHRLLPSLIHNLSAQKSVNLSQGIQVRDFIYVEDVCSGIETTLNALLNKSLESGTYNISTGVGTPVAEFCKMTAHIMGAREELLNFGALPLRPDDYEMVVGDSQLLQKKTNWKPKFTLEAGIIESLKSYSSQSIKKEFHNNG